MVIMNAIWAETRSQPIPGRLIAISSYFERNTKNHHQKIFEIASCSEVYTDLNEKIRVEKNVEFWLFLNSKYGKYIGDHGFGECSAL